MSGVNSKYPLVLPENIVLTTAVLLTINGI